MKEYNRLLDEQEEQRAQELAARMERSAPSTLHSRASLESGCNEGCSSQWPTFTSYIKAF